ncbi:hypothetical protein [Alkalinema sp. FACHB-956]|uniref:hypothetical protein n=1 Tax=Alkalinema sp. FACHB-956 TaxID=2692768 RepID=UPI001683CEAE|nr:hypothetical protein [Alkalinema sp. FACHB-956]MBD2325942.1 hypothetical protein [Alkalinema sp. FACHB-956]
MKSTIARVTCLLACVGITQSTPKVQAQLPDPGLANPTSQPTARQLLALQASGLRVALPSFVPEGFRLHQVFITTRRSSRLGGYNYTAIYEKVAGAQTQCFAIEATSGGIGDLPPSKIASYPINAKASQFSQGSLEVDQYGKSTTPTLLSSWLSDTTIAAPAAFYRFTGAGVIPELAQCSNLSPQEAVTVIESLQYVPVFNPVNP